MQVACGLIFSRDKILVTRRDRIRAYPLKWEFPGGKLEENESPEEALLRELVEELDFKVQIIKALKPVIFHGDGPQLELFPFVCIPGQIMGPRPIDHTEIRWIQPESACSLDWVQADIPLVQQLPAIVKIPLNPSRYLHSAKSSV